MKKLSIKQLNAQLRHERIVFSIQIICCLIMMVGMSMNFTVMMANGGKMPVKWDVNYTDEKHFTYQNDSEISYHHYADIYEFPDGIYSLGDLVMLLAIVLIFGCLFYVIYKITKQIIKHQTKKNGRKK